MDLSKISAGLDPPHDINVVIEIPQGGEPVKYIHGLTQQGMGF